MKKTKIITVFSHKGGTGKSTITINLATALSIAGKNVGVVSFDSQNDSLALVSDDVVGVGMKKAIQGGNLFKSVKFLKQGVNYYPIETDVIGVTLKSKFKNEVLKECEKREYDYLIIDNSATRVSNLTSLSFEMADEILVPTSLDKLSINAIGRLIDELVNKNMIDKLSYIIPNLYNGWATEKEKLQELKDALVGVDVFLSEPIKRKSYIQKLSENEKTVFDYSNKLAVEFQTIYIEIVGKIIAG
jgi:cellulose biosynthesis protein BcsQ